jgi:hypothetical protein
MCRSGPKAGRRLLPHVILGLALRAAAILVQNKLNKKGNL